MSSETPARTWFLVALVVVGLAQTAALFKMVYDRDQLLKTGREISIATQPVDPRDIFRGDYVTLGYGISMYRNSNTASMPDPPNLERGGSVYATLSPDASGAWTISGITAAYPEKVDPSNVVMRGEIRSLWQDEKQAVTVVGLRYGIESYFVPESTGKGIEDAVRNHKVEAIISVDPSGTAALKGLVVNGERRVDPPLL
jgi:uncharacterized membrane-anchored protein